jgi:hypothetical protein
MPLNLRPRRKYQYQPLPKGDWIRLFRVLPGEGKDFLRVELFTINLHRTPSYEALSYVWGDPSKEETILCDGSQLAITANLHNALNRLRNRTTT